MQVPENEVMDQTALAGPLLHKQTSGFTAVLSKVSTYFAKPREYLSISARILCTPKSFCFLLPSISIFGGKPVSIFCQFAM